MAFNYSDKFESFKENPSFRKLTHQQQQFVRDIAFEHHLTFQEFRQVVEASLDLSLWSEGELQNWWKEQISKTVLTGKPLKKHLLHELDAHLQKLKSMPKVYPQQRLSRPKRREKNRISTQSSDKQVYGMCPVASEKTVCCQLRTIDAVENCIFGCSYCTIQTFYSDQIFFDENFVEKLNRIELDPQRFYHFGSGQSSDSLAWGNRNGILDALCQFARQHPNILLEFKTKSNNIRYFLENETPNNIVCSWSLNTSVIIENEEHFTASLEQRLQAARTIADYGIKVAFHFHPLVYYQGWEKDYTDIAERLTTQFDPEEVLFVSFGTVTFIKPVIKKIRQLTYPTKMHQMPFATDPHGKLTYPDDIKISLFEIIYDAFNPWHEDLFFYLCMEKASIWETLFGYVYQSNDEFEKDFGIKTMRKIGNLLHSQND